MKYLLGFGILGLVLGVGGFMWYFSIVNGEARLRNKAVAQQKANEAVFDNMWKTIAQVSNVADDHKEDFRTSWKEILTSQNSGERGGMINVVINKINPQLDSSLRKRVQTVVEASRKEFLNNQKQLIDIKREHDNMRTTAPSMWFVGTVPELEITIVTSTRTGDVFDAGKDDNIDLRPGKKEEKAAK
jgi:hypothetical protein